MRFFICLQMLFCVVFSGIKTNIGYFTVMKAGTQLLKKTVVIMISENYDKFINNNAYIEYEYPVARLQGKLISVADTEGYEYYGSHFYMDSICDFAQEAPGIRSFVIIRDPRDVCVSMVDYVDKRRVELGSFIFRALIPECEWNLFSRDEKLSWVIQEFTFKEQFTRALRMSKNKNVCLIHFENLIGEKGGGCDVLQRGEVEKIANFLEIDLTKFEVEKVCDSLFGDSKALFAASDTFFKGQIGRYKEDFKPFHYEQIEKSFGRDFLEELIERTSISARVE